MATSISSVDYQQIPGKTTEMREHAQTLNGKITEAYGKVSEMKKNWYGIRYNALVKKFNDIIPKLNEMLKLVVSEIPDTLDTVAKNYAKVDGGSVSTNQGLVPTQIELIVESTDVGMRFEEAEVSDTQKIVDKDFGDAIEAMNSIESTYNSITWTSDAATAFKTKFNTLKKDIVDSFSDIKENFESLMTQTISDMKSAESANTVQQ